MPRKLTLYVLVCLFIGGCFAVSTVKEHVHTVSKNMVAYSLNAVTLWTSAVEALKRDLFFPVPVAQKTAHFFYGQNNQLCLESSVYTASEGRPAKVQAISLEFAYDRVKIPRQNTMTIKIEDDTTSVDARCTFSYKQYQQDTPLPFSVAAVSTNPKDLIYDKIRAEAIRRP